MKTFLLAMLVTTIATSDALADPRVVTGNNTKFTNDCSKHKEVLVVGNHNGVTLKGTCDRLIVSGNHATVKGSATTVTISGNQNQVDLDETDQIVISGNENKVTWRKSSAKNGPSTSNTGNKNKVTKAQ
jgi:hypothetical protein